jgi:type II secretory pathway component GspD/PulD (secretin)
MRPDLRFHLTSDRVPLRDLLGALASASGLVLDLGGREVIGTIEVSSDERGLTIEQLWRVVNEQLVANALAIVQRPGHEALSLVKLDEAAGLARIEPNGVDGAHAGYVRVLYRVQAREPRALATALAELMPKGRTAAVALDAAAHLAVAGLRGDVEQALVALALLDGPRVELSTVDIPIANASPTIVAGRLEQIVQKQTPSGARPLGWFFASPETSSILVGAPVEEMPQWRELIARFDAASAFATRSYVPRRFAVEDVAKLVEQVVGSDAPSFRLVKDELTGALIVTASEAIHGRIAALFERLEGTEYGAREELRSFEVRHRDAKELVEGLERLLDVEAGNGGSDEAGTAAGDSVVAPEARPRPSGRLVGGNPQQLRMTVDEVTNRILVFAEPRVLRQIEKLLAELDTLEPQVLVEATVVGLTEREVIALGVELRGAVSANDASGEVASLFGLGTVPLSDFAVPPLSGTGGALTLLDPGDFSAVVRALETVSGGRSLSRPRLVTRNHKTAELDSVLESPYAATVSTDVIATTSFGGASEAGTQISVTPHLTSGDRLRVEYAVTLSAFVGDAADPALPPPKQQTILKSEAVVPDGFTVVLGGIELESSGDTASRVPLLGRLPLVGWLFGESSHSSERTRFYVFLRCDVLRNESFRGLRDVSAEAARAAGIGSDVPVLEPRWMR